MSCDVSLILAQKIAFSWSSTSSRVVLKNEVARGFSQIYRSSVSAISNKHEFSGTLISVALQIKIYSQITINSRRYVFA